MGEILLFSVVGGVALLVSLLAVPVEFRFRASLAAPDRPLERSGRIRWAFGLVDRPLAAGGRAAPPKPGKKKRRGRGMPKPLRGLLLNPAVWRRVRLLLARLFHTLDWRRLSLHGRFGLDDPADTGRLWGSIAPLLLFTLPARFDLRIGPVFTGADLAFEGEGELRLVPLRVVGVLLRFALSPATWRLLWPLLRR